MYSPTNSNLTANARYFGHSLMLIAEYYATFSLFQWSQRHVFMKTPCICLAHNSISLGYRFSYITAVMM